MKQDKKVTVHSNDTLKLYQDFIETSQDLIWQCDDEGRYIYLNPAWEDTFGYRLDQMIGRKFTDFQTAGMARRDRAEFRRLLEGGIIKGYETIHLSSSKKEIHLIFNAKAVRDESGAIIGTRGTAYDITEQKTAQAKLVASHSLLEKLARLVPSVIYQYRLYPDGRSAFPYSSPGMNEIYEVTPDEVREDASVVFGRLHPDDLDRIVTDIQRSADTLEIFYCEFRVNLPRQGIRWRWCQAHPERLEDGSTLWHGIISDITERKNAEVMQKRYEEQLHQTQKLESLGILAGGIAHDFNNLMSGIYGYVEMAHEYSKDQHVKLNLSKAINTIERTRALTRQLLTFAKGGAPVLKVDTLFPLIAETTQFALSGSNIVAKYDVASNLRACSYDRNQIAQVIDNLVINAQQAMPSGGIIVIAARNVVFGPKEHHKLPEGNFVKVSIKDHGVGIPKKILPNIFDPFFTTKQKGHGLGLATCYSIITRHDGYIDVESKPGKGTSFHIYLPASLENSELATQAMTVEHFGNGTFLVMDDEEVIRETVRDMLILDGYTVVCTTNGNEAIEFVNRHLEKGGKLAGIIFDLTVPGNMGGKEAASNIRKAHQKIPIFVASGYADDPVMKSPQDFGFTASICKPFRKSELDAMLNQHLLNG